MRLRGPRAWKQVLTNGLGRDELAEEGAEEDESKWEGDPDEVLQRQVGLHLVVGPLVGCRDTHPGSGQGGGTSLPVPRRRTGQCKEHARAGAIPFDLARWCYCHLTRAWGT